MQSCSWPEVLQQLAALSAEPDLQMRGRRTHADPAASSSSDTTDTYSASTTSASNADTTAGTTSTAATGTTRADAVPR